MSNQTPDGWKETTIGQLTHSDSLFCDGDWVESKDQDPLGTNRLIQLADIGDGYFINKSSRYLNDEQFSRLKCTAIIKGDILVARMPEPLGRACIYPLDKGRATTIVDIAIIRTKNVEAYWLMAYINSDSYRNQIDLNASGTTRTRIARGALSQLKLLCPPLPEQQKIAAILTSIDDVIEKTQAQINKLKDLKTGMMQELLTRGVGVGVGVDGKQHTEFKDSPVGRIPKGWDCVRLDELASVIDSMHKTPVFSTSGKAMVRVTEIRQSEMLNISGAMIVDEPTFELFSKNYRPKIGDILIARVGAYFGATAYVERADCFCLGQNTASIRPKYINAEFLFIYLNSEIVKQQMNDAVAVGAQPSLSLKAIKDLKIVVPSIDEQKLIARAVSGVRRKVLIQERKLKQNKNIKKALMQDLLTGKVRVNVE